MQKKLVTAIALTMGATLSIEAFATEWNVSLWGKRRAFTEHVEKLAELVEQKTDGQFKLNLSYGGLSKNKENLDGISIGAFEMAQFCAGYHPDKNPSITVMELPFLGVSSLRQEADISMAVYNHPAAKKDLDRWNATLLMPSPLPQYNILGKGEAPSTLNDFEGLAVRATGGIGAAMREVGAVPSSMSASEVRQALDSGVISAASFAPHAHMSFGTVEVGEWWTTNLNPGSVNCPVVVNSDALSDLSDEHREALLSSVDESLDYYINFYENKTMARWWPTLEERGIKQVSFSDDALAAFRERVAAPAAKAWLADMEAKGVDGQSLIDLVESELAK
jgi:TRAP-type C4-dicarboxylate transport system substrate-binding protein